jgi:hypothetical protein
MGAWVKGRRRTSPSRFPPYVAGLRLAQVRDGDSYGAPETRLRRHQHRSRGGGVRGERQRGEQSRVTRCGRPVLVRVPAAGLLMVLTLASCTGSPDAATPPKAEASTRLVPTPTPEPVVESPTTSVSLRCTHGTQRRLVGVRNEIFGGVFAPRLVSPPSRHYTNKILWTSSQAGSADLLIFASLNGSTLHVVRRVDGVGTPGSSRPSIIDVPQAGCWTFSLRWGELRDLVAVRYGRSG